MLPNPYVFGLEIAWFPLFHWLGVFTGYAFGIWYFKPNGQQRTSYAKMVFFLLLLMPLALLGARVPGIIESYVATGNWPPLTAFFWGPSAGVFRWCGTLLAFVLLLPYLAKKMGILNYRNIADTIALSLCPLTAIVKQGCLFSGDGCYGIPTALPWGMYFPYGPAPNILPAHPTPLYDGLFHLALFGFLLWWNRRKSFEGQTALFYFLIAPVFYILLETIRLNPATSFGPTVPQATYFVIIVIALMWYPKWRKLPLKIKFKTQDQA